VNENAVWRGQRLKAGQVRCSSRARKRII
jgi:hypothetical protein